MIEVNEERRIVDESFFALTRINCQNCIYVVKMEEQDGEEEYLVCGLTGPANTVQLPSKYRCVNGKWLCRQYSSDEYSPVGVLTFDSILNHRLANVENLEVLELWF